MHELSLAMSLVSEAQDILRQNNASRATSITVELGPLSGVDAGAFEFAFPEAIKGTALSDCRLVLIQCPLKIYCQKCQVEQELDAPPLHCPKCFNLDVTVQKGREFKMTQMEIE